jgi:hypothetical protein
MKTNKITKQIGAAVFIAGITLLSLAPATQAGPFGGFGRRSDGGMSAARHGADDRAGHNANDDRGRNRGRDRRGNDDPAPTPSPAATPDDHGQHGPGHR